MGGRRTRLNVLVFPGATETALEIWRSLRHCKDIVLYSASADVSNHAPFVFARHFVVPTVHEPNWMQSLNRLVVSHGIDYVFPAHDDALVALAQHADRIGARIVASPLETCLATRSKSATYRLLGRVVPVPTVYESPELVPDYPVFAKPDRGQGSRGAQVVRDARQLSALVAEGDNHIVMEYLPGEEYTVDCFSDRDAGLLFCAGRQRIRTRSGIAMNSRPVDDDRFLEYGRAIAGALTFHGAWFFQVRKDRRGIPKLLEVSPRIAGTMSVHAVQGINFPLLSIYEQERYPIEIMANRADVEVDRALVSRFRHNLRYGAVYVDLDDTLILNGAVNVDLVRFLFQCVNRHIRLLLVTKCEGDPGRILERHRLSGLFDEILHVERSGSKAEYIARGDAIFIDDSFNERKAVRERLGIPTFDCSMVDMLVDDRV
jgi:carbamoyl-phosphate synthase large subunit